MGQLGITIGIERTKSIKQKLGREMYFAIFFILCYLCGQQHPCQQSGVTPRIQHSQSSLKELVLSFYCFLNYMHGKAHERKKHFRKSNWLYPH